MDSYSTSSGASNRLLPPEALSELLGVPTGTLANWRCQGKGPPWYRVGRQVRYRENEIEEWLRQQKNGGENNATEKKEREMALPLSGGRQNLVRFNRLKGHKTKQARALRRETDARDMVIRGQNPNQRLIVRPFSAAAEDFLKWTAMEHREHPNTHRRLVSSFVSLKAFFGGSPVGAITEGIIEDFKTGRRQNGIKEVTVRHDLYALSKFFQYAIKQRWAARNPIRNVGMPSDADAIRMHVLADAEEKLYFQRASGDLYDLGRLMLNQGCRPEEILRLRQSDVDLENRKLYIRGGKTKAARRTLTLTVESMHILAHRLRNGSEWVFPSPKCPGKPRARLNNQHDAILKKTGLSFVFYDFRHTLATRLAQAGVDLPTIAAILGHSGLRVGQRYIHVTEEHQKAAMLRYDATIQEAEKGRASFGPVLQ